MGSMYVVVLGPWGLYFGEISKLRYDLWPDMKMKRILVAMSGGVDSATTAALLKEQGHEVIGVTMQLWDYRDADGGCCSPDDVRDARTVADQIGIPHYVVNYMELFKKYVVSDFVSKYESGQTPIPCVLCNQFMKFNFLLKRALELGADYLATGHYARIDREQKNGTLYLGKALDENKDQSYFLFTLTQKELRHLIFPLGSKTKAEVREIARRMNLNVASKSESMGVCFITGERYRDFLDRYLKRGKQRGVIVDEDGNEVGEHNGIASYTVGQRRGLGVARGKPMYVTRIEPDGNRVYVGESKNLFRSTLVANNVTWVGEVPSGVVDVKAKIRYRHPANESTLNIASGDRVIVQFKEPQRAITPGQAVVFYNDERVLGGGWIKEVGQ
jgi:tRNA-specific 2-thiouridylase